MATKTNTEHEKLITGTSGDDSIQNGGYWDNTWHNGGDSVTINTGAGDDTVVNYEGDSVTINTGAGNDYVDNSGSDVTINTGEGDDYVYNYGSSVTIDTGAGNDSVYNYYGDSVTISGGKGNDSIYNNCYRQSDGSIYYWNDNEGSNVLFKYAEGDGNDIIYGFKDNSTLSITGGTYTRSTVGNDVIVKVGSGKISLIGAATLDAVNVKFKETVTETNTWKLSGTTAIYGTSSKTLITVNGVKSTSGLSVNDKVVTVSKASVNATKITISDGYTLKLADDVSAPSTKKAAWTIDGTTATYKQTTSAGYKLASDSKSITYSTSSTKTLATVTGVKSLDGLSLSGNVVTVAASSLNKKKVTISGDGYTLKLADGVQAPTTKKAAWTLSDSTATYKSSYKTAGYKLASNAKSISYSKATTAEVLLTVEGVKSLDGLSLSGNVVTVAASSLNKKKVTISGDGYTLALADGVTAPTTKKAAWTLSDSTATYKSSYKTAGYKLASNAKSISYSKATTATTLASVKGAKAKPTISNDVIKLKTSTINSKVTLSGSYEFDFASGNYQKAKVLGSSSADKITSHGKNISLNGGAGNDTIKVYGSATSVKGGAGADVFVFDGGSGVITDYAAEDKISIASGTVDATTSGNNVIFTVGSKKITVKGGKDKTITYIENGKNKTYTYQEEPEPSVGVITDGKTITLTEDYMESNFDVATYGNSYQTIDASAAPLGINIKGNNLQNRIIGTTDNDTIDGGASADSIDGGTGNDSIFGGTGNDTLHGGKGNDTLKGGSGSDVFVYSKGDGKDVIQDYTADEDIISIASGVADIKTSGKNVIFTVGSGKITVTGGKSQVIAYSDDNGSESYYFNMVNIDGTKKIAKLSANYSAESLKATDFEAITEVTTIDASAVHSGLRITGSGKNESIIGGYGNDTIIGGTGKDSLTGGTGKDYFRYESGDGNDVIEDYSPEDNDVIQIMSGHVSDEVAVEGYDVVFSMVGGGSIRVKKGKGKEITFVNKKDEVISPSGTYTKSTMQDATWFTEDDTNFNTSQLDSIIKTTTAAAYQLELTTPLTNDKTLITYGGKK